MIYKGFVVGTGKNTLTAATVTFANPNAYYDPSVDTSPSTENDSIFLMGMNTVYSATASFTTTASVGNGDIFTSATAFTAQGQFNLIYGTMANQVLYGGAGNETINGGGGSDSMDGGAGGINLVSFGTIGTGTNNAQIDPYGIGVYVNLLTGVYNYGTTIRTVRANIPVGPERLCTLPRFGAAMAMIPLSATTTMTRCGAMPVPTAFMAAMATT